MLLVSQWTNWVERSGTLRGHEACNERDREEERRHECVGRYEGYLRRLGLLTDERAAEFRAEAAETMRRGIAQAEAEPPADPALLFAHAFVDPPASFGSDLEELRRVLGD